MIDERIDIQVVLLCTIPPFTLTYSTLFFFFFFNDTATTEIYTLSLHDALPISHWRLRMATLAGAASTSRAMAKLLGFQRCRPRYCSTYFEAIARKPPSANGQSRSTRGLIRSARLMPVM